jgi:DnaK suppressor protein
MSNPRHTQLKQMLEHHRRQLQQTLGARLDDLRACNDSRKVVEALDDAEASDSDLQQEFGVAMAEMAAETLILVDGALERLANGTYSCCVDCNERIADKRLTAMPFALRCRECEELSEIEARHSRRFSAARDNSSPTVSVTFRRARADQRE